MRRVRQGLRVVVVLAGIAALFAGALVAFRVDVATTGQPELYQAFGMRSDESILDQDPTGAALLAAILSPVPIEGRCGRPIAGAFRDGISGEDISVDGARFSEEAFDSFLADLGDLGIDDVGADVRAAVFATCRDAARLRLAIAAGLVVIGVETLYIGVARPTLRREREPEPSPPLPSPAPS